MLPGVAVVTVMLLCCSYNCDEVVLPGVAVSLTHYSKRVCTFDNNGCTNNFLWRV